MRRMKACIEAFALDPSGEPGVRLSCPASAVPRAGQAVLALLPQSGQTLRRVLFPTHCTSTGFTTDRPPEPAWRLGDELDLLGPVGRGFSPPDDARRWFLASLDCPPSRLLPLIPLGLFEGAAVSLWSPQAPAGLPPQVELVSDPREALAWCDYLAFDIPPEALPRLRQIFFSDPDIPWSRPRGFRRDSADSRRGWGGSASPRASQVLVAPPMPCGLGVCGACNLKAPRGWRCACTDGPVFDLDELAW